MTTKEIKLSVATAKDLMSGNRDQFREIVRDLLQELLEAEMTETLSAGKPVAAQHGPDRLDLLCRQAGEVCKSAFFDLAVFAVGFTQGHGGWRATVGHDLDMHVY